MPKSTTSQKNDDEENCSPDVRPFIDSSSSPETALKQQENNLRIKMVKIEQQVEPEI